MQALHLSSGSLSCGRLFGISIRIHGLFLLVLVLQVLAVWGAGWRHMLLRFWLLGPVLAGTVLIHELGHCLAARWVGGEAHSILLWPLGGLAYVGHTAGPKADMVVAVAGPLTHVPMTGLWLLLLTVAQHTNSGAWSAPSLVLPQPSTAALMWQAICAGAVAINISLAAFNLLVPAYPLDGGRLLADSLLACGVPPPTAAKVTVGLAAPLGLGIVAWSLAPHHVQITLTCVGAFILVATWELWSHVRRGTLDQHPLFAFRKSSLEIVAVSC